jgi:hypothetical protein
MILTQFSPSALAKFTVDYQFSDILAEDEKASFNLLPSTAYNSEIFSVLSG